MTSTPRPTTGHTLVLAPELRQRRDGFHEATITYRDRVFVICSEGVGNEVVDGKPWNAGGIAYTRQQILNIATTPGRDTVQLEDWIRQFGDRLEGNFHLWNRTLTIARDDLHEAECGDLLATAAAKDEHEPGCKWCRFAAVGWDDTPLPTA